MTKAQMQTEIESLRQQVKGLLARVDELEKRPPLIVNVDKSVSYPVPWMPAPVILPQPQWNPPHWPTIICNDDSVRPSLTGAVPQCGPSYGGVPPLNGCSRTVTSC
jgi:hypothetical protein